MTACGTWELKPLRLMRSQLGSGTRIAIEYHSSLCPPPPRGSVFGQIELREVKTQTIAPSTNRQLGHGGSFFERFRNRPIFPGQLGADSVGDMNSRVYRFVDPEVHIDDIEVSPLKLGHQILAHKGRFARAPWYGQNHATTGTN